MTRHLRKYFLLFVFMVCIMPSSIAQGLDSFKWKNRLLLLFVPEGQTDALSAQIDFLQKHKEGLKERALLLITIHPLNLSGPNVFEPDPAQIQELWKACQPDQHRLTILLLGLDGEEKWRTSAISDIEQLFARIDAMPIRQAEIKRRK